MLKYEYVLIGDCKMTVYVNNLGMWDYIYIVNVWEFMSVLHISWEFE